MTLLPAPSRATRRQVPRLIRHTLHAAHHQPRGPCDMGGAERVGAVTNLTGSHIIAHIISHP